MKTKYSIPFFSFTQINVKYLLIFIGLYLFFLLSNLPASTVISEIKLPGAIKLSAISGSVWSGQAKQLQYSGIELGSVKWALHPLHLLLGELAADVSIVNNKQFIKTEITLSPAGKIELEETRLFIDLSLLQPLTYGMPFSYAGMVSGYFPNALFHKNNYIGINGKLSLNSLELISPQQELFGDLIIGFRADEGDATLAQIKDAGGPLDIEGQAKLTKTGQFNFSAKVAAREKGGSLEQMLSLFGKPDARGRVQVNSDLTLWH